MNLYEVVCVSTGEVQNLYMDASFGVGDKVLLDFGDGSCVWKITKKYYRGGKRNVF